VKEKERKRTVFIRLCIYTLITTLGQRDPEFQWHGAAHCVYGSSSRTRHCCPTSQPPLSPQQRQ